MIDDHTLCYGHPWHKLCQICARNITDKIKSVDYEVFDILPSAPLDLKNKKCDKFSKKLFYKSKKK